jgi:2-keto-4-pentenoate hydratase
MDERVERGMRRQLDAAPEDAIGWKMALNAPAIMEALGLEEPALGRLSASRVISGSHSLARSAQPAVEPELVLEAGEGGKLARIGVALEVVDFDRGLDDVEEVVAANVFHRAVALSDLVGARDPGEAVFSLTGSEPARLSTGDAPPSTLRWVDGFLGRLGGGLAPGELVIAGALCAPAPVSAGDVAELKVAGVGSVRLEFTP